MRWSIGILIWLAACTTGWSTPVDTLIITEQFSNEELKTVFSLLERKYAIRLAYEEAAISGVRVSCRLYRLGLKAAFERLLKGTALDFRVVDERHVMIRRAGWSQQENTTGLPEQPAPPLIQLQGRVTDALSGEPLPFAAVFLPASNEGTAADENGVFAFNIRDTGAGLVVQAQFLGYLPRQIRLDDPAPQKLNIALHPQVLEIPRITIQEPAPLLANQVAAGRLRADGIQLSRASAGFNDLFRSIQLLPGVQAANDLSAGFQIRGGDNGDNLLILDGMTLYRVDHFYGLFSAINPYLIGQVDLYKNAFPARFGGATAGVLEMTTRQLDSPVLSGGAEANLINSTAFLNAPLGKNLSLLAGGRISNGDLSEGDLFDLATQQRSSSFVSSNPNNSLSRQALLARTPNFRFYDLNGRLSWSPAPATRLAFNFFRSYDRYSNNYDTSFTNTFRRRVSNTQRYREYSEWANNGLSLQIDHEWGSGLKSFFTASRSGFLNNNRIETSLIRKSGERTDTTITAGNLNDNRIRAYEVHLRTEWSVARGQLLTLGYQGQQQRIAYLLEVDQNPVLAGDDGAWTHHAYVQGDHALGRIVNLRGSLRASYFSPGGKTYWSPRLLLRMEPIAGLNGHFSWSRYVQFLREVDYENRFGASQPFFVLADEQLFPVAVANQLSLGASYTGEGFSLEAEYFTRKLDGALEYALVLLGFNPNQEAPARRLEYTVFNGENHTHGLDLALRKTRGAYTGWIAYTLSTSTNSFPSVLNGQEFPAANDQRHQFKIVNQYVWKNWQFNASFLFASGRPYLNLDQLLLRQALNDRRTIPINERISYLENYERLDLGLSYNLPLGRSQLRLGASVLNVFDRANVKYRQYVFAIPENPRPNGASQSTVIGNELQQLGRVINLSVSWEF